MKYSVLNKKRDEVTVKLEREIYKELQDVLEIKNLDVKNTMTKLAKDYTQREKLFEYYEAYMSLVSVIENSMFIKDVKKDLTAEIKLEYIHDKEDMVRIYCRSCKTDYCPHVAYALGRNEIGELHLNLKQSKK